MTYVKINGNIYPAEISGRTHDSEWDNRDSKSITLEMDYATASALFVDGVAWAIVYKQEVQTYDKNDEQIGTEMQTTEYNNVEYCIAGDITDHRDGRITVKMGKLTDIEQAYEMMLGGM